MATEELYTQRLGLMATEELYTLPMKDKIRRVKWDVGNHQYDGSSKYEFHKEFKVRVRAKEECISESIGLSPMSESERV